MVLEGIVKVRGIGPMECRGQINAVGDITFFGRTGEKTISTITINRKNIRYNRDGSISFEEPYEQDKTHDMGSQKEAYQELNQDLLSKGI